MRLKSVLETKLLGVQMYKEIKYKAVKVQICIKLNGTTPISLSP